MSLSIVAKLASILELLALSIQSVSLSPDGAERVVAAARQRAGTLETGTDPSLSITMVIEADSEDLDTLGVPPDSKSSTEPPLTTTGNSDTLPLVPTAHNSPKLVLVSEHKVATHGDSVFYVPARDVSGPYYLITKGRALGIIAGWCVLLCFLTACQIIDFY